jgi:hypothetical protein
VLLLGQQIGKSDALCARNSAIENEYARCIACLQSRGGDSFNFIETYINQFYNLGFCVAEAASPVVATSAVPTTISSPNESITQCSPYPTQISSKISTSSTVATTTALKTASGTNATSSTSYNLGFWLQYTFTLCPTRTINPSFSYPTACLSPELMWGCPSGYVCNPPQVNCDVEVGPPADTYACVLDDCIPAPPIVTYTSIPVNGTPYSPLPLNTGYFNLNPVIFGADWGLFTGAVSVTSFSSATIVVSTFTPTASRPRTSNICLQSPNNYFRSLLI